MNALMTPPAMQSVLKNPSSFPDWNVHIDETGAAFHLEIDARKLYLILKIDALEAVRSAVEYLRKPVVAEIAFGTFAGAKATLRWDDESRRCFLVILGIDGCVLRHTFLDRDIDGFREALSEALDFYES